MVASAVETSWEQSTNKKTGAKPFTDLLMDSPFFHLSSLPGGDYSFLRLRAFLFGWFSSLGFGGTLPTFGSRFSVSGSSGTPDGCLINQTSCFLVVITVFFFTESVPIHFFYSPTGRSRP
ncbi:MAG TPA: hypothetical protein VGS96_13265 [Thermoanaerobaculia bacterium]|jgi:hypothetical protein|nr:hypothetical protein [Thermoanaerobaculia bacterium]